MTEKTRGAKRTRLPSDIIGEVTVFQPMLVLDVSELGIQIELATPLQNDSLHEFRLPLDDLHVVAKGRVVYCHAAEGEDGRTAHRCGIEFVQLPQHALEALRLFIAEREIRPQPRTVDGEVEQA